MAITIGRVTDTPGARIHMAFTDGTPCGTAAGARITRPVAKYRNIAIANLCKRCFTPANLTRAQAEATGRRFNAALDEFLCTVRLTVGYGPEPKAAPARPVPTQRPALALAAPIAAAAPAPRTWGQLQAAFAKTHPQTARTAA